MCSLKPTRGARLIRIVGGDLLTRAFRDLDLVHKIIFEYQAEIFTATFRTSTARGAHSNMGKGLSTFSR